MTAHAGAGGVNKAVSAIHVGASSAWKEVTDAWVGSGGTWKKFYENVPPISGTVDISALNGQTYGNSGINPVDTPPITSVLNFEADGTVAWYVSPPGSSLGPFTTWLASGTNNGLFEIRLTLNSGTDPGGIVGLGWFALDEVRQVGMASEGGGLSASITAEIRYNGGAVLTSATFTVAATYDV